MLKAKSVFVDAPYSIQQEFDRLIDMYGSKFGLVMPSDYAAFFATLLAEVGTKAVIKAENMNYSAAGLKNTFRVFRNNPALADKLGRSKTSPAKTEAIANYAYANRNGNGSVESGDGWNYRGRGFIQITGRSNYAAVSKVIEEVTGSNFMLEELPDIAGTATGAVMSALAYWKLHGLSGKSIDEITDRVNKYTDSRSKRKNLYASLLTQLGATNV